MNRLIFLGLFTLLLYFLENFFRFKTYPLKNRVGHTLTNLSMALVSNILLKSVLFLLTLYSIDFFSFNLLKLPKGLNFLYLIILDFLIYIQHILSHRLNWFWSFHKVHHADHFLDTSSGLRFHPLEILISYFYKMFFVVLLGVNKEVFVIYEIMLTSFALFNHSNIEIPMKVERYLNLVFATPNFHRVHHSKENSLMNSHYGNTLSIWDRLCKTYYKDELDLVKLKKQSIGLNHIEETRADSIKEMLTFPLSRD